jgi:phage-related protein
MAKDPKVMGLSPKDESYKLLLEGLAKRQEAAAKKQEEAAKAQLEANESNNNVAEELHNSAQSLSKSSDNIEKATSEQAKLTNELSNVFNEVKDSIGSFTKVVDTVVEQSSVNGTANNDANRPNKVDIFTQIYNVNKEILYATKLNTTLLEDVLSAMLNQKALSNAKLKETPNQPAKNAVNTKSTASMGDLGQLGTILSGIAIALGAAYGAVQGWVKAIMRVGEILKSAVKVVEDIVKVFFDLGKAVFNVFESVVRALVPEKIIAKIESLFESIVGIVKSSVNLIKDFFEAPLKLIEDAFGAIRESVANSIKTITTTVEDFFTVIKDAFTISKDSSIGKTFSVFKDTISSIGELISAILEPFEGVLDILKSLGSADGPVSSIFKTFKSFAKVFGTVAEIVGKIFEPIMVIMAVWDSVQGAIEGYQKEGVLGAVKGAVTGLFNSLIFGPLDLLKDLTSWVLNSLGFKNASKFLNSFSFEDLFKKLVDAVTSPISWIIDKVSQAFKGIGKAVYSALTKIPGVSWIIDKFKSVFGGEESEAATPEVTPASPGMSQARNLERARTDTIAVETPVYDEMGNYVGTSITPVLGPDTNTVTTSAAPVTHNAQYLQKLKENAIANDTSSTSAPVIVNNNTVNNNGGGAGPSSAQGPATGGSVATAPQSAPLDKVLYGSHYGGGFQ